MRGMGRSLRPQFPWHHGGQKTWSADRNWRLKYLEVGGGNVSLIKPKESPTAERLGRVRSLFHILLSDVQRIAGAGCGLRGGKMRKCRILIKGHTLGLN